MLSSLVAPGSTSDPSRNQGVHRNNHRTMHEFFEEYSGEVLVTRFAAQSYSVWLIPSL